MYIVIPSAGGNQVPPAVAPRDVFEHAFMLDYGLKRADCIEAFFGYIDWKAVETRLG
ncbi:MAG: Fe-Mn family superoxide dismutase [Oryzomonas sp.]|nr:Fe-Mn family superoxide dismutase [Oryzomonas sp.]MDR3580462.1 Fe-Mn family superoxide dismutase [Oryzomonas sp.]